MKPLGDFYPLTRCLFMGDPCVLSLPFFAGVMAMGLCSFKGFFYRWLGKR